MWDGYLYVEGERKRPGGSCQGDGGTRKHSLRTGGRTEGQNAGWLLVKHLHLQRNPGEVGAGKGTGQGLFVCTTCLQCFHHICVPEAYLLESLWGPGSSNKILYLSTISKISMCLLKPWNPTLRV